MKIDFTKAQWLNQPAISEVSETVVKIVTEPETDLWQRSYYGFQNDNAPMLLLENGTNFTFTTKVTFAYKGQFDQCGVAIYINSDNWFKASLEYEDIGLSRLGSVVTNLGYSDWATVDVQTYTSMWYRLSRRGPDFLIESSLDGITFKQMRIFHLHLLGDTSAEMGQLDPPAPAEKTARFGLYACSPTDSSFEAVFSEFCLEECRWRAHSTE